MLGMHGSAFANYAVEDCDFLITVGARFDDRVAGVRRSSRRERGRIAHLDIDRAEINKVKRVHWSHVGQLARRSGARRLGRRDGLPPCRPFRPGTHVLEAAQRARDELRPRQPA
jgi:acetolactate synthase-1/2/3 large subunit